MVDSWLRRQLHACSKARNEWKLTSEDNDDNNNQNHGNINCNKLYGLEYTYTGYKRFLFIVNADWDHTYFDRLVQERRNSC